MSEQLATRNSVVLWLALLGVCAATGMAGLPIAFGIAALPAWTTVVWLVAALAVSLVALLAVRPFSAALALNVPGVLPSDARLLARLVAFVLALIIAQASLRRPLALLVGGAAINPVEAAIAAIALAVVLALLVWAYQTAQPLVKSLTLQALDAAIPTVEASPVAEPTHTVSVVGAGSVPSATEAATVRVTADDAPTIRTPVAEDEPTLRAAEND